MPLLLSAIPWRLIAVLGIAAGLFFGAMYVVAQLKQVGALKVENAQLKSDLEASKKVAAKVSAGAKKKADIGHKADQRRKAINNALPEDDGPISRVLRDTLDGLRPDPNAKPPGDSSS